MEILTNYFKRRLTDYGYSSDLDVHYNLSHCQGDGMAFYGAIGTTELPPLIERFAPTASCVNAELSVPDQLRLRRRRGLLEALLKVYEEWHRVDLEIRKNSDFYHHSNSMEVTTDSLAVDEVIEFLRFEDDEIDDDERETLIESVKHGGPIWGAFLEWLQEDVESISETLEREGYNIMECTRSEPRVVWERETPNFRVTVELEGDLDGIEVVQLERTPR